MRVFIGLRGILVRIVSVKNVGCLFVHLVPPTLVIFFLVERTPNVHMMQETLISYVGNATKDGKMVTERI